jgi:hypothetical protein|eukprot:Transcript_24504.p1 GENE.Transcript_24504~~Transcript_24504.p1  ORF type:complete len:228 (+),score=13.62 Transcript_24504:108-791(+)
MPPCEEDLSYERLNPALYERMARAAVAERYAPDSSWATSSAQPEPSSSWSSAPPTKAFHWAAFYGRHHTQSFARSPMPRICRHASPASSSFSRARSVAGLALSVLIESDHLTHALLGLFCSEYTLGSFGQIWADWHAVGCAFVGVVNLCVAVDDGSAFRPQGMAAIARCTTFIYLTWGVQNTYYCLFRTDIFTPLMWLNALACNFTAAWSAWASVVCARQPADKSLM